jgi:hypothetical protein
MDISITFERTLYQAVIRFKQEHPGALEARTRQRNERPNNQTPSTCRKE